MTIPAEFDEIRPYAPEELPAVFEELIADPAFHYVTSIVYKDVPFEKLAEQLRKCRTGLDVQKTFFVPLLQQSADQTTCGMDMDATSISDKEGNYTFVSNHRDIVMDSAYLSMLLLGQQFSTTVEIAIGDNLLVYPWIKKLLRVSKSFIVQRSLSVRQVLESSMRMSRYMHYAIKEKHENIWIAQREGRAKDSNDLTQDSILKMMAMGGEGSIKERLKSLHIVPLSISYEYDPCDYLKAQEFQQKRDNPAFKKTREDDLLNMNTGIFGFKGKVHYHMGECLDNWLDTLDNNMTKNQLYESVARHIDEEIHKAYRIYPGNYVAADMLENGVRFDSFYTEEQKNIFETYLQEKLDKIVLPEKDISFLRDCMLKMYSNPLYNYLKASTVQ